MRKLLLYFFMFFSLSTYAQQIKLKILDYSTNLSIDDADIYFAQSTKNFVSGLDGKVVVDLTNINSTDDLIVSKKDYQDAKIKVVDLKTDLTVKLEKISEVELQEAFVSNLKAEDILQKVYENYDKNFTTEEHYYVVNFKQDLVYNKTQRDFIDTDLQFKFKKGDLKIKSKGKVNNEIKSGREPNSNIRLNFYLQDNYLKDRYIKSLLSHFNDKSYVESKLKLSKYGNQYVYEIFLKSKSKEYSITIDKNTFAVVEFYWENYVPYIKLTENEKLTVAKVLYKYRPHDGDWVLKETSLVWNTEYEKDNIKEILDMNFNIIVNDYSSQPFPEFKKNVNEKMDIRRSFN